MYPIGSKWINRSKHEFHEYYYGKTYILVEQEKNLVGLHNQIYTRIATSNSWAGYVWVKDSNNITIEEWWRITGRVKFEPVNRSLDYAQGF